MEDFIVASNKLGAYEIFSLIYASSLGIGSTVAAAELGFINGISASWWEIAGDVIIVLAAFGLVKYMRTYVRFSIFEIIERTFGVNTRIISALLMSVGLFTMSVAQLVGCSVILSSGMGIPMKWALLVTTTIVLVVLISGGMRGIGYANVFHTTVSMIGTFVLLGFCLWRLGGIKSLIMNLPPTHLNLGGMGMSETFAWFLAQFFRFAISATIIQIILAAKDTKTAIIGTMAGATGMLLVGVSSVLIGMSSRALWPSISPKFAESYAAMQMPPVIAGFVLSGIFASLTGTVAVYWLSISTLLTFDIFEKTRQRAVSTITLLTVVRATSALMAIVAIVFALFPQPYMLHLNITGISLISIVSILVLFALFKKIHPITGLVGLSGGFGCMLVWMGLGEPFSINRIYVSTLSTIMFLLTANYIFAISSGRLYHNLVFSVRDLLEEDQKLRMELTNNILDKISIRMDLN